MQSHSDAPNPRPEAAGEDLPAYDAHLRAFHRAFRRELWAIVRSLPAKRATRVLDLACGDGFYTALLARRFAPGGEVVAADLSPAYLRKARKQVSRTTDSRPTAPVRFAKVDAYRLPFDEGSFDLVWCAQSLITFGETERALREMARVTRPGGRVAVLESDEFHHVLVNWPVGTELAVQQAVADAARAKYGTSAKLSPARRVGRLMRQAGLTRVRKRTFAADRTAPFDPATTAFLRHHFATTRKLVAGHLPMEQLTAVDRFTNPTDGDSIFRRADAEVTCMNTLFVGRKSENEDRRDKPGGS